MSRVRVVVTGLGHVTSLGHARAVVDAALREGRTGIEAVTYWDNPAIPVRVVGTVKGFHCPGPEWREWRWPAEYVVDREVLRGLSPHGLYAVCAVQQALAEAGLARGDLGDGGTGMYCASAGSPQALVHHVNRLREARGERGHPMGVVMSIAGTLNFNLGAHFGIRGAVGGFAAACASSSHALGAAVDELRLGRQRRMIVVGGEEMAPESVLPFAAMRALSTNPDPLRASRPFDAGRDGFVATGGAAAMVLETEAVARARGAQVLAEVLGWGHAGDGTSVALSHPEGDGLARAMESALADAGLAPSDIGHVNAHATSTPQGDRSEALALRRVFTDRGARPAVTSTKGLTGHGLSYAGVMEAVFCVLALRGGYVPGNANLVDPDPACEGLDLPRVAEERRLRVVMNNSSGFGGSNVSHVFGSVDGRW